MLTVALACGPLAASKWAQLMVSTCAQHISLSEQPETPGSLRGPGEFPRTLQVLGHDTDGHDTDVACGSAGAHEHTRVGRCARTSDASCKRMPALPAMQATYTATFDQLVPHAVVPAACKSTDTRHTLSCLLPASQLTHVTRHTSHAVVPAACKSTDTRHTLSCPLPGGYINKTHTRTAAAAERSWLAAAHACCSACRAPVTKPRCPRPRPIPAAGTRGRVASRR
eukprot:361755-Chlamydomonas_euryale.AAC.1